MEENCFCGSSIFRHGKCILHCKKSNSFSSEENNKIFLDALVEYIIKKLKLFEQRYEDVRLRQYFLEDNSFNLSEKELCEFVRDQHIVFEDIYFPLADVNDHWNYELVIAKLGKVEFNKCEFLNFSFDLQKTEYFFYESIFHNNWYISQIGLLENETDAIYCQCEFKKDIQVVGSKKTAKDGDSSSCLFSDCKFNGVVTFKEMYFQNKVFNNSSDYKTKLINKLFISNCIFDDKYVLNNAAIDSFECIDTIFKNKFEFKNNTVKDIKINNSNFIKLADFFGSKFDMFRVEKSIFEDFVGFERCEFGTALTLKENHVAVFEYATFLSFVNFRDIHLHSGLNLRNINFKEAPNFLGIQISNGNTNRETYRIVKSSFDKQSNYIEANKFYALEMAAREKELKNTKGSSQDKFIFWLGGIVSNHSTDWFKALKWIFGFGLAMFFLYQWRIDKYIFDANAFLEYGKYHFNIGDFLDEFAKFMNPFSKKIDDNGAKGYAIWLTHKVFSGFLIYHFIVSLRRNTKR